jgi:hypothetical protein
VPSTTVFRKSRRPHLCRVRSRLSYFPPDCGCLEGTCARHVRPRTSIMALIRPDFS